MAEDEAKDKDDPVELASDESFPASDPPGWTGVVARPPVTPSPEDVVADTVHKKRREKTRSRLRKQGG